MRDLGNQELPPPKDGEAVSFVLDGQQRLTSLFATLHGLKIERDSGQQDDISGIYVDLNAKVDEQIVIMDIEGRDERTFIPSDTQKRGAQLPHGLISTDPGHDGLPPPALPHRLQGPTIPKAAYTFLPTQKQDKRSVGTILFACRLVLYYPEYPIARFGECLSRRGLA